ncbi:MAG: DUF4272 domain-containing protein [Pirellulales bacterium]
MAQEPITLFSRFAERSRAARRLRELDPQLQLDGTDDDWLEAIVSFGSGTECRRLTFRYSSEYCAEPNWTTQMRGMAAYFHRFPRSPNKERAIMLTTTFKLALSTEFDPEFEPEGDPRLSTLFAVAEAIDGILMTPSSLRDRNGRILFGAGGEDEEDAEAIWPNVVGAVDVRRSADADEDEETEELQPPGAARVARRALALAALTGRAILEQSPNNEETTGHLRDIVAWLKELGINDELEPDEWRVLQRPIGRLESQDQINATWRLEALGVLAWALGRFEIPPHDRLVETNPLWQSVGLFDVEVARTLLSSPTLRPRDEIDERRERQFAVHWRIRNFGLNRQVLNFAEFAKTCWFGPLNISGLPLVDGDLALAGKRIDQADPDSFRVAQSAAQERHQAVNWLWAGPEKFSEAGTDT